MILKMKEIIRNKNLYEYSSIVSKDSSYKLYFDKISTYGLINIFEDIYFSYDIDFLVGMIKDILVNDNNVLYLSSNYSKLDILDKLLINNYENIISEYNLYIDDSYYNFSNINDIENSIIEYVSKIQRINNDNKLSNNIVIIDKIIESDNMNYNKLKYIAKKYNVIIVALNSFDKDTCELIYTRYDSKMINWDFFVNLIMNRYIKIIDVSDLIMILLNKDYHIDNNECMLYIISYDNIYGNREYNSCIGLTFNLVTK